MFLVPKYAGQSVQRENNVETRHASSLHCVLCVFARNFSFVFNKSKTFWIERQGKHITMTIGERIITIPRANQLTLLQWQVL